MKCPIDNETLVISERSNIEIDYCPNCRGVWLDRGELDKLIERTSSQDRYIPPQNDNTDYKNQSNHSQSHHNDHYKKKKKESLLGEIFDF